jgi:hypothetical protein
MILFYSEVVVRLSRLYGKNRLHRSGAYLTKKELLGKIVCRRVYRREAHAFNSPYISAAREHFSRAIARGQSRSYM